MQSLNHLAEQYVKLSLRIGQHCPNYVDAYYGPKEWQPTAQPSPLSQLKSELEALIAAATDIAQPILAEQQRFELLLIQLKASLVYVDMLQGHYQPFAQECANLYDATPPLYDEHYFDNILDQLDGLLPGHGDVAQRLSEYRQQFVIPTDKLETVFVAAIDEARRRTLLHIDLPSHENFKVTLVNDQVWSAYNWYKGNSYSVIELNTDFPIQIERAIDLAAHEGYPGHHVFNALIEQHLVEGKGWLEYSIYNLFSPISLLAEGSANYGIEVAFPWDERLTFEQQTLFPLAGIDAELCQHYYKVQRVLQQLSYSDNMVAGRFVDGNINEYEAIKLLMKYALNSEERAHQRLAFIKQNRAYVITYNYGQDLVRDYLAKQVTNNSHSELWRVFTQLLAQPKTASMMLG